MFFCDFPIIGEEKGLPLYLVTVGQHICQPRTVREKGYSYPQILYCTRGSGVLLTGGRRTEIPPQTAVFLPADFPHEYYPTAEEWDIRWVVPDGYACGQLLEFLGFSGAEVFRLGETSLLEHYFRRMHDSLSSDRLYGNFRASGYLYDFLIELARIKSMKASAVSSNRAIAAAVGYINEHYAERITMEQLCRAANLSKQQLCRLFSRYLNARPMEFAAKRRIQAAKELLSSTSLPIEEIAEQVGFCSGSYFSKLFLRYEGITPSDFRKR